MRGWPKSQHDQYHSVSDIVVTSNNVLHITILPDVPKESGGKPYVRRKVFLSGQDYPYSAPFAGIAIPNSFITICKSFQVSFFCRGSRSRNAG